MTKKRFKLSMAALGLLAAFFMVLIAVLLAGTLRSSFIKPLFLIMMMVRFHALIENQPLNQEWDARLATISDKFRDLGTQAATSLFAMPLRATPAIAFCTASMMTTTATPNMRRRSSHRSRPA